MYLLQFIAGGISILKEKKGEKDNAHYWLPYKIRVFIYCLQESGEAHKHTVSHQKAMKVSCWFISCRISVLHSKALLAHKTATAASTSSHVWMPPGGFPLSVPSLPARLPVLKPDGEGLPQMSVRQPLWRICRHGSTGFPYCFSFYFHFHSFSYSFFPCPHQAVLRFRLPTQIPADCSVPHKEGLSL